MQTAKVIPILYTSPSLFVQEEFGCAAKAGGLLRKSLYPIIYDSEDCRRSAALIPTLMKMVNSDAVHGWGDRRIQFGEPGLLEGFEFNARKKVNSMLMCPVHAHINPISGCGSIDIAPFIPRQLLRYAQSSTHVQFIGAAVGIDFMNGEFDLVTDRSAMLGLDESATIQLRMNVPPHTDRQVFLLLGIELFRFTCHHFYKTGLGGTLSLRILKAARCAQAVA